MYDKFEYLLALEKEKHFGRAAQVCGVSQPNLSAALVVTPDLRVEQLVGAFVLIHAGFAIAVIDEAEARSRQQVFAALGGGDGLIDLDDFYLATTGVARAHAPEESSGNPADTAAQSIQQAARHV